MKNIIELYEASILDIEDTLNNDIVYRLAELKKLQDINLVNRGIQTIRWECPKLLEKYLYPKLKQKYFKNQPPIGFALKIRVSEIECRLLIYIIDDKDRSPLFCESDWEFVGNKSKGFENILEVLKLISKSEKHFEKFLELFNSTYNSINNGQAPDFIIYQLKNTLRKI